MIQPTSSPLEGLTAYDALQELLEHAEQLPERVRQLLDAIRDELRRSEGDLLEAESRFRALVEQIPAIVYIDLADESMVTTYVSPQIESLLGITPQEYLDDPNLWTERLHPDDRKRALATYEHGRRSGEPFTFEYRLLASDGRPVWFRDSAVVLRNADGDPSYIEGVMLDITDLKAAEEQAAFLAYHDSLTDLPNRAMFRELLDLAIARAQRHDMAVAAILVNLDGFKLVNDSLGHERGDELLRLLADRLRAATRETDFVARPGGDEFLMLLADLERDAQPETPGGADAATFTAEAVASRIQEALRAPFVIDGNEIYVQASIGIALFPLHAGDADELLRDADVAMYQSKELGPGGCAVYSDQGAGALGKLSLTTRLRKAVENQNWELHYQPVVSLTDGATVGVEALIRWNDPSGGLVPPGEFIPLAEEMGLIEVIGDWVVEELVRQDEIWRAAGLEMELSFNLSPRQLWQPSIAERILSRLEAGAVDPTRVLVEVTESAAMVDPDKMLRVLEELHGRGLRLAIDDFGTGYSSLSRLKQLPVDVLKIDRSFVREVHADRQAGSMVRAVIQLADGLEMTSLAEGIETEEERRFLVDHGCRLGQGFHFSRPVPGADILARHRRDGFRIVEDGAA